MLLTWMAYATLVSALLLAGAHALNALALQRRVATRFIWLATLLAAVVVPTAIGLRRSAPVAIIPANRVAARSSNVGVASASQGPTAVARAPQFRLRLLIWLVKIDRYAGRIWLSASLVYVVLLAHGAITLRRRRRQWRAAEIDGHAVMVSANVGPAVVGVTRARIVIPEWTLSLDRTARALMLRHETEHIAARDPVVLLGAVFITAIFPWNAAMWVLVRRLRLAIEVDCDRRVLRETTDARGYAELLLTVGSRRPATAFLLGASLAERHGLLEQRIRAMTSSTPRHPRIAAATLVVLALAVTTAAVRAPRPGPVARRSIAAADSLTVAELRALLIAHQPEALVAASGINTVTILLDANGNYITSLSERREVSTGGGRGGRGGRGEARALVISGDLSTGPDTGIAFRSEIRNVPGGRARGNVRDGFPSDSVPVPPTGIVKSNQRQTVNPVTGVAETTMRVTSLSMIEGDTVLLSFRSSSGETGFIKHVNIVLHGKIGAGEIFGFNENVLANLVDLDQVDAVHAHAYAGGEVGEGRLNVFMVRLKP